MKGLRDRYYSKGYLDFEAGKLEKWCILTGSVKAIMVFLSGTFILRYLSLPSLINSILFFLIFSFSIFLGILVYGIMWDGEFIIGRNYWKSMAALSPFFIAISEKDFLVSLIWYFKIMGLLLSFIYAIFFFHIYKKIEFSANRRYREKLK